MTEKVEKFVITTVQEIVKMLRISDWSRWLPTFAKNELGLGIYFVTF